MMYNNKMAAAIRVNGKVLREFKDTVYVKFGSEYSVYMKNLNTQRAVVNVFIDGTNITPGGLVINAGQEVDLQRSIANGNLTEGNSLKFIERTSSVEQHRGIKLEDGLVRVEFQFEMPTISVQDFLNKNQWNHKEFWNSTAVDKISGALGPTTTNSILRSRGMPLSSNASYSSVSDTYAMAQNVSAQSCYDTGITVPGSKSTQSFSTTYVNALDPVKHTMIFKLLGETLDNEKVRNPVTVKTKQKCVTCGKQNKMTSKFCTECGTALTIYS